MCLHPSKRFSRPLSIEPHRKQHQPPPQEQNRTEASTAPVTGKFLVGSVPCLIRFGFDNSFSWMREKVISYKVTVTPPSAETLGAGRRRRAKACLAAVSEDLKSAQKRLNGATSQKHETQDEVEALERQLEQKKKSLAAVVAEEKWLKERVGLRSEQLQLLNQRLEGGWSDEEPEANGK